VGASAVGGYGDYFAWGAVYPQARYKNEDYRESIGAQDLVPGKDIAYQKLGSDWHMPTEAEINSIFNTSTKKPADGVTWKWISNTATYGTEGYEVYLTSNSSKKIFLPAAGYWYDGFSYAGSGARYWSSKYRLMAAAYYLEFSSSSQDWDTLNRCYGLSVRPVHN